MGKGKRGKKRPGEPYGQKKSPGGALEGEPDGSGCSDYLFDVRTQRIGVATTLNKRLMLPLDIGHLTSGQRCDAVISDHVVVSCQLVALSTEPYMDAITAAIVTRAARAAAAGIDA